MSSTSSAINIRASTSGTNGGSSGHGNLILRKQLMELRKRPVDGFSAGLVDDDNLLEWDIMIIGCVVFLLGPGYQTPEYSTQNKPVRHRPADTLYEGAFLKARLTFPEVCSPAILTLRTI
ncbi:hypothetical protein QFC21_002103 [Naganishia friedmannii]|uniref:Uncharacterized protein n=1 Tax=Naganishia friedmannii TaxID=89922 RepID=A0ACC2VYQ5_9TREE|nr:hypothetical protein QFC21_002103 [Naganishia friedmannii]